MELAVKAAGWVVGKALGPVTDGMLEAWAASEGLGSNVDELKVELLYAQAMLDNAREREIRSPALKELLNKLRKLAYDADDVLDELEYFRIQDQLDGTYRAANEHAGGCVKNLFLNASETASAVVAKLKPSSGSRQDGKQDDAAKQGCLSSACSCGGRAVFSSPPSPTNKDDQRDNGDGKGRRFFRGALPSKLQGCCGKRAMGSSQPSPTSQQRDKNFGYGCMLKVTSTACNTAKSIGKCLPCCSSQSDDGNGKQFLSCAWRSKVQQEKNNAQAPKLKFDRVEISTKMKDITEHLKPVCAKVSNILNLEFMGTNRITKKEDIAKKRTMTNEYIAEDSQLYGRDILKGRIIDGITLTNGEYYANELVVLPIVGPGGIGKTTFTRHVYDEVKSHFGVAIWICVSLSFHASRLAKEAVKGILGDEKGKGSDQELIEQKLKGKRFLLVLDDIWECPENEWRKLLAPFTKGGEKGNMVIVTTRFPKVAEMVKRKVDSPINMERLDDEDFRRFFQACIFGDQQPWEGHEDLREDGEKILKKLKGFPLEAKTVGRLLKSQFTPEHWRRVRESKEWEFQTEEDDIMPALKLSYDYLPFHLQQCFYYCALFPEDYEFQSKELVHFWIGLDIVHPCDPKNRRIEDVGEDYLRDLTNHGFFKKNERSGGCPYYVIHDLLHNLAVQISSFECLSIHISNVMSAQIPQDVRHLSIIVDNKDVEDIKTFKYYKSDLSALDKRLKIENLRTLMVFGEHHGSFVKTFFDLFEKARALRAIYLSEASYLSGVPYTMKDMLCNFSELIHLRYLRIESANMESTCLLNALSRLYHLEVIDLQLWRTCSVFPRHMNNLAKLRLFLVPGYQLELHSSIIEVGKMKLLQELRSFEVGKQSKGFELSQLGQLSELGGSLAIRNLERIRATEEASEARLIQMKRLQELTLEWGSNRQEKDIAHEENSLEILIPHSNLQHLCIRGHGGTKCPQWLGENLSVKNLESLHLDGVAWKKFPPIGELQLVNEPHEEIPGNMPDTKFEGLRRLELVKLRWLEKWVAHTPCQLFAHLEELIIRDCSELMELSFPHSTCCHQENEASMSWFPKLQNLEIEGCPNLMSFPPVPWTSGTCSARIEGIGLGFENLVCGENYRSEYILVITGKDGLDSTVWNLLDFDNLPELKVLEMTGCPPLPLQHHFKMLSSLRTLELSNSSSIVIPLVEGEGRAEYQFPIESITICRWGAGAKELTHLLTYFPKLSELFVRYSEKITGLGVVEKHGTATPAPSPSVNKVDVAQIEVHQQQDGTSGEGEISAEGLLLLHSQLQELHIDNCQELILLRSIPADYNTDEGRTGGGQGLQGLTSLRRLVINSCPKFLSSYSSSASPACCPFPTSLDYLSLSDVEGMETLLPLSNLTSLTHLTIVGCGDLRGEGLRPLLVQGSLTKLTIQQTPNFFAGFEPSPPHEQELPPSSSKLQKLQTDDVTGVLVAPICALLSSSLTDLRFWGDKEVERFTKEQEEALQLLPSLERIRFWNYDKLQSLPAGLHKLSNLKRLGIFGCAAIRSLPKDSLPSSLQELEIKYCPVIRSLPKNSLPSSLQELKIVWCPAIRSMPKDCLPSSLQKLVIWNCPDIQSLPKVDDLPSSLRELDVRDSNSEKLRRQCRKFKGTIPIVRA